MERNAFTESQQKHLVSIGDDGWAFVPPDLPPQLDISQLTIPLANASNAIGELKGAARRLQNPYMLINPLLRREALTSSAMEGTITTLGDMLLEEAGGQPEKRDDAREASNYRAAVITCTHRMLNIPLSHRVIKEAHEILLSNLSAERGSNKRPGEYKTYQNAIGKKGDTIRSARFVPPPPEVALKCMDHLEAYMNRPDIAPHQRLLDLALAHYQFEAIHPFDDGNGRIGRMMVTLLAQQLGLLDHPILHISSYLEDRKDAYIDSMFAVSAHGEWERWIAFFLETVTESARDATNIVDEILGLQTTLLQKVRALGKSHNRLQAIVDGLFDQWWTDGNLTSIRCQVSFPTAQKDLRTLTQAGILLEVPTNRSKIYYSPDVLRLSDRRP